MHCAMLIFSLSHQSTSLKIETLSVSTFLSFPISMVEKEAFNTQKKDAFRWDWFGISFYSNY
jgi:hypothetical protein